MKTAAAQFQENLAAGMPWNTAVILAREEQERLFPEIFDNDLVAEQKAARKAKRARVKREKEKVIK